MKEKENTKHDVNENEKLSFYYDEDTQDKSGQFTQVPDNTLKDTHNDD